MTAPTTAAPPTVGLTLAIPTVQVLASAAVQAATLALAALIPMPVVTAIELAPLPELTGTLAHDGRLAGTAAPTGRLTGTTFPE